jgi:hypothetical protein
LTDRITKVRKANPGLSQFEEKSRGNSTAVNGSVDAEKILITPTKVVKKKAVRSRKMVCKTHEDCNEGKCRIIKKPIKSKKKPNSATSKPSKKPRKIRYRTVSQCVCNENWKGIYCDQDEAVTEMIN